MFVRLRRYGTRVAGGDVLCEEAALHADGGFRDFLEVRATDALLERAGRVREWPNQPLGLYEYLGLDQDILTVRDHHSGQQVEVLHVGCSAGTEPGQLVFGRLVPIDTAPSRMFEQRPISVDPTTAKRLADELDDGSFEGLMAIFAEAGAAGRMPDRPGTRVGTYLWSDVLRRCRWSRPTPDTTSLHPRSSRPPASIARRRGLDRPGARSRSACRSRSARHVLSWRGWPTAGAAEMTGRALDAYEAGGRRFRGIIPRAVWSVAERIVFGEGGESTRSGTTARGRFGTTRGKRVNTASTVHGRPSRTAVTLEARGSARTTSWTRTVSSLAINATSFASMSLAESGKWSASPIGFGWASAR